MKKVLITGITGFVGSHLAEFLINRGFEVFGLDIVPGDQRDSIMHDAKIYNVSVKNKDKISDLITKIKPDYIFHFAALITSDDMKDLFETNVLGTQNILDSISNINAKIFIPGSGAEYGAVRKNELPITEVTSLRPLTFYGLSKVTQTLLALNYYKRYTYNIYIARSFNITGPREPGSLICSSIARQIVDIENGRGEPIVSVGNLDTKRDFTDIRDVVEAYWAIVSKGIPGEIYNVCSGNARSVGQIAAMYKGLTKISFEIRQESSRIRIVDIPVHYGTNKKIVDATGWSPKIDFKKTLRDLLEYYRRKKQ